MAFLIDWKRGTSPISRTQVSAVIGPTPGTVLKRVSRSASSGSRSRPLLKLSRETIKVAHLVQPLLVVAHTGLHQQARDPVLHLNHLLYQQSAVAQCTPSVADLGRCHIALRKEITA